MPLKKVSIIYYSSTGSTATLAKEVQKGADSVSAIETQLIAINVKDIVEGRYKNQEVLQQLNESDAIVFGTPTFFGNMAAQFKAFLDATIGIWVKQEWKNKIAAGFTVSGTPSGDKLNTLQALNVFAMQHGMIWIGTGELPVQPNGINRLASWLGAMAEANPQHELNKDDLINAEAYGKRIAETTLKFNN